MVSPPDRRRRETIKARFGDVRLTSPLSAKTVPANPARWQRCWPGMIEPTSGELLIDDHPLHYGDYSFEATYSGMIFRTPRVTESTSTYFADHDFPLRLNTDLEPEQRRKQVSRRCVWWVCARSRELLPICWRRGRNSDWSLAARADFTLKSLSRTKPRHRLICPHALAAHQS